jgi:hypothetical protein
MSAVDFIELIPAATGYRAVFALHLEGDELAQAIDAGEFDVDILPVAAWAVDADGSGRPLVIDGTGLVLADKERADGFGLIGLLSAEQGDEIAEELARDRYVSLLDGTADAESSEE